MTLPDDHDDEGQALSAEDEQLGAHIDEAWAAFERGDLAAARTATDAALALAADSPEAITVLGSIDAAHGRVDQAMAHFARAVELAPDYIEPYLHAAELQIYPVGDAARAVELCDAALGVAEEEVEYLDALLLKTEALLELGQEDAARAALAELPPAGLPEAQLEYRAGRAFIDTGDLAAAERHLRAAMVLEPELIDALHAIGLVHEERGDWKQMVQVFLQVRERDLAEAPPPWGVTHERFEELARAALAELPQQIRDRLENVPVIAADYPAIELCAEGNDPRMMGFFSGVPFPEKSALGAVPHLDCVFLYKRNIERACRSQPEVDDEIRRTLIHETGHFFGLSEEDLEAIGLA